MDIPATRIAEAEQIGQGLTESVSGVEPGEVNRPLLSALGDAGLLDAIFSPQGVTATELCAIRHGLARANTNAETAFALQGLGAIPIQIAARDNVREKWIPGVRSGSVISAFALTEPGAGSDAGAIALKADADGDGFRLTGDKIYISNAPHADIYSVFARTDESAGSRGVTAFAVPGDSVGLSGESISMLSPHPIGSLRFDGVHVPAEMVLGDVNGGFRVAMRTLDLFRPSVGAFALGMAEAALAEGVRHAGEREAFGQPISSFQGISHQLADVRVAIESATYLIYAAAHAHDSGLQEKLTGMAAMAKLAATETAQKAVDVAIQVLGARGLEKSSLLAHLYLEVRAPRIYEGTSEIQRNIIAREMFRGRI